MKCVIENCKNEDWQGDFNVNLCQPCYNELIFIIHKEGPSQYLRNLKAKAKEYIRESEYFKVDKEWS